MKGIYRKQKKPSNHLPKWLKEVLRKLGKETREMGLPEAKKEKKT